MQTAALYIRVSTDDQTEYSPSAQKKALLDYAKKNKYHIVKDFIFMDEGFSGKKAEKRPAFMKMIGMAKTKEKPFDTILVHKFDRFARNREDSVVYKSMLRKECGVKVISITESLDSDDKMSVIIEAILEAMAEYYSINLAEEVKKGMTEKARQGGYQTTPPLGYKMENNQLSILDEEAQYVRFIFEQYVNHNRSPYQIAKKLNELGVKSKRGNKMDLRGVEYILQNPVYIGMVRWTPTEKVRRNFNHPDTIIVKGSHEAIVKEELFESAKQKLEVAIKKRKPRARPTTECKHWLSGLVKCSDCGTSLAVASSLKYPSFQCTSYSKGQCAVSHAITIKKLESAIFNELNTALESSDSTMFTPNIVRTDEKEDEIKLLKNQLSKIDDKLKRVNEAYLAEIYTLDEFKEQKKHLEQKRENLKMDINNLQNSQPTIVHKQFKNRLSKLIDILNSDMDMDAKQKAVRSIIEKIVYDKANESLEVYYYDM